MINDKIPTPPLLISGDYFPVLRKKVLLVVEFLLSYFRSTKLLLSLSCYLRYYFFSDQNRLVWCYLFNFVDSILYPGSEYKEKLNWQNFRAVLGYWCSRAQYSVEAGPCICGDNFQSKRLRSLLSIVAILLSISNNVCYQICRKSLGIYLLFSIFFSVKWYISKILMSPKFY